MIDLPDGYGRRDLPEQLRRFFADNIERCLELSMNRKTGELSRAVATARLHQLMRASAVAWLTGAEREGAEFVLNTIWVEPPMRYLCAVMIDREIGARRRQWTQRAESGEDVKKLSELKPEKRAILSYRAEATWPTKFAEHMSYEELDLVMQQDRKIADKHDKRGDFVQGVLDLWDERAPDARTLGEAMDAD